MDYTKILRWVLIIGLCLTPFIAFIVADGSLGGLVPNLFFPYITGKNFAFRILIEILTACYVVLAIREPKYRPRASYVMWAVGLLVLWMALSTATAIDPIKSFWSNFERMDGYITTLHLFALFVIAGAVLTVEEWWDRFFVVSVWASVMQGVYAVLQAYMLFHFAPSSQSGARADTTFGNATYLAVFMLFNFFITIYLMLRKPHRSWVREALGKPVVMTLYSIALLLQFLGLYYTESRGPLLGLAGGVFLAAVFILLSGSTNPLKKWLRLFQPIYVAAVIIIGIAIILTSSVQVLVGFAFTALAIEAIYLLACIFLLYRVSGFNRNFPRTLSAIGVVTVIVLTLGFFGLKNTSLIQKSPTLARVASISLSDKTTDSRFLIWGEAWQGFKQSPKTVILGWGQENFSYVFNEYYNPQMYDQEQWFDRAHNQFIDMTIDGGLPAGLLYIALFLLAAWTIIKSRLEVSEQAVFLGLLAAYAFNNLFVFDNLISYLYFFAILAFAHGLSEKKPHGWMFMSRPLGDRAVAVAAPLALIALVWGGYLLNGPGIVRAETLIAALTPVDATGAAKDPSVNLAEFKSALGDGPLGYQETVEQLFQFSSNQIAQSTTVSPDTQQAAYTLTQQAGDAMLLQRKGDARLELFYGVFLDQVGQYQAALAHLQNAIADSPKKQQILFEIGATYLAAGDNKDALPPLKEAYDETPQYDQAQLYYATALYYNGDTTDADAILIKNFGTVDVDQQQILQAYFATKMYSRLEAIYAARVAKDPTDVQSAVAGAVLQYFVSGNKSVGIAALNALIKANPSLASQIQSFIDQINAGTLKP